MKENRLLERKNPRAKRKNGGRKANVGTQVRDGHGEAIPRDRGIEVQVESEKDRASRAKPVISKCHPINGVVFERAQGLHNLTPRGRCQQNR